MTPDAELAALVAASYYQTPDVNAGGDARAKFVTRGQEFIVIIPGTATALGLMRDLEAWPAWDKTLGPCHAGFLANGHALWMAVWPHIPQGKEIIFAGHSLGGAEAQILAVLHGAPCRVVTFGSPRIALDCNLLFRPLIRRAAPQLTLYARPDDPVPHVPPAILYRHAKRNTSIGVAAPGSDNEFPVDPVNDVNHGIKLYVEDLQKASQAQQKGTHTLTMLNTVTVNIESDQGFHKFFLQQDADVKRTVHALIDKVAYTITGCSASTDGTTIAGKTVVKISVLGVTVASFTDAVAMTVDPTAEALTMTIVDDKTFSGILGAAQAADLVAFIKACGLPSLAA